ncbi:MAG TPA: nucleotidyltransferase domain-containing protein, partial [Ktedonobacteraceae bacterium]|nr:nucleotidyltransferase domain-containing protein [Ktedonobacteraceae bacterium]
MGDFDTFSEVTSGQLHPTPYVDVNAVLHDFQGRIQTILVNHFIGMYLYGSLALGDFDPHSSDIDFIVVTDKELADDAFEAIKEMHARFDESPCVWAGKVEAAYIPLHALSHMAPTDVTYPQIEKGTALFRSPLETGWIFQRYTLREHGVIVAGPDPHTLVDPVDSSDMRLAVPVIPKMW